MIIQENRIVGMHVGTEDGYNVFTTTTRFVKDRSKFLSKSARFGESSIEKPDDYEDTTRFEEEEVFQEYRRYGIAAIAEREGDSWKNEIKVLYSMTKEQKDEIYEVYNNQGYTEEARKLYVKYAGGKTGFKQFVSESVKNEIRLPCDLGIPDGSQIVSQETNPFEILCQIEAKRNKILETRLHNKVSSAESVNSAKNKLVELQNHTTKEVTQVNQSSEEMQSTLKQESTIKMIQKLMPSQELHTLELPVVPVVPPQHNQMLLRETKDSMPMVQLEQATPQLTKSSKRNVKRLKKLERLSQLLNTHGIAH
jgi:hypothetical protein